MNVESRKYKKYVRWFAESGMEGYFPGLVPGESEYVKHLTNIEDIVDSCFGDIADAIEEYACNENDDDDDSDYRYVSGDESRYSFSD